MVELYHGSFYSLFRDSDCFLWVVSTIFASIRYGPFTSLSYSLSLMKDANYFMNLIISKGVLSHV